MHAKKSPAQLNAEIAEALAGRSKEPRSAKHASSKAHATVKRVPKTRLVFVVQGNYGYGHGWEDVTAEESSKEARDRIREYRENERGVPFRLIRRRERIAAAA
jgi:hypothetical protein